MPSHEHRARPSLERLETRTAPAVFTVAPTAADGAAGSLRAAINAANSNSDASNTINLAAGTYSLSPAAGELLVQNFGFAAPNKSLSLVGQGPQQTVIQPGAGPWFSRIFEIVGTTVQMKGLTIKGGSASEGGGLLIDGGQVTLSNVAVRSNQAVGRAGGRSGTWGGTTSGDTAFGGGIYVAEGSLTLVNSTVTNNKALGGNGASGSASAGAGYGGKAEGGGIFVSSGQLVLTSSAVNGNAARGGAGGNGITSYNAGPGGGGGAAEGGGIFLDTLGDMTVTGGSISNNQAIGGAGGNGGNGLYAGPSFGSAGHDGAAGGAGGDGWGGGVGVTGSGVSAPVLVNCAINGNSVLGGAGGNGGDGGNGTTGWGGAGGAGGNGGGAGGGGLALRVVSASLYGGSLVQDSVVSGNGGNGGQGGNSSGGDGGSGGNGGNGGWEGDGGVSTYADGDCVALFSGTEPAGTVDITGTTLGGTGHSGKGGLGGAGGLALGGGSPGSAGASGTGAGAPFGSLVSGNAVYGRMVLASQPPPSLAAGAPFGVTVRVLDGFGSLATLYTGPVTLSLSSNPGHATLQGTTSRLASGGTALFMGLSIPVAASGYALTTSSGSFVSQTTSRFTVTPAASTHLAITTAPPSSVTAGSPFGLTVKVEDAYGNVVTGYSGPVTLLLSSNPGHAALHGLTTVTAHAGVAAFTGLSLTTAASGYVLKASAGTLVAATSKAVTVTPAAATHLAITTAPPSSVTAGSPFGLTVKVEDAYGNVVTGYSGLVTLLLSSNPGHAALHGTLTVSAHSGVAVFTGLSLSTPGSGYVLKATSGALGPALTGSLTVTPAARASVALAPLPAPARRTNGWDLVEES